ncbi:uncharacterized protein PHACADRAFT_128102 [Phanerochaete carnosa HHB-10118-sp]|uniref:Uncharacterized protein n=1 Tax=Phanerochaete carnosa (strain HHB-10118-sp) TaxID=650164 RepID=K5VKT0_PHACS|nr:uncharacterized protein PHACADRAFT_128102 [Phanerochaete carnosa HHB-10118-sp]EKM52003.1 hypothetical protein PHACADRAFT_128102 [Phanerochaete carnosa HHB-10118-sp]
MLPDILVLNASLMGHRLLVDMDMAEFDAHINMNVKGPLFFVQSATQDMKPGTQIIFVSTTLMRVSSMQLMALLYASLKGAVKQLVQVLAQDLGVRGMTVKVIVPGAVDTPLFRAGKPPHLICWVASLHSQNRIPHPDEISPLVAFVV